MPSKDKLKVGTNRRSMTSISRSLHSKLNKYWDNPRISKDPDAYVREQLKTHNMSHLYYPGIAEDLKSGAVRNSNDIMGNMSYKKWTRLPENEAQANEAKKRAGQPFTEQHSTKEPDEIEFAKRNIQHAQEIGNRMFPQIGQPTPLEQPVNDMIMRMLDQYNQGKGIGAEHLSGFGAFPGLKENLSALGSGAYNAASALGRGAQQTGDVLSARGKNAYGALNPYLQNAATQGQSYLSAAQPYAQRAADLGGDIFNAIRAPAMAMGQQVKQGGLGSLLNILRGRA
jgi:hypothetical protein